MNDLKHFSKQHLKEQLSYIKDNYVDIINKESKYKKFKGDLFDIIKTNFIKYNGDTTDLLIKLVKQIYMNVKLYGVPCTMLMTPAKLTFKNLKLGISKSQKSTESRLRVLQKEGVIKRLDMPNKYGSFYILLVDINEPFVRPNKRHITADKIAVDNLPLEIQPIKKEEEEALQIMENEDIEKAKELKRKEWLALIEADEKAKQEKQLQSAEQRIDAILNEEEQEEDTPIINTQSLQERISQLEDAEEPLNDFKTIGDIINKYEQQHEEPDFMQSALKELETIKIGEEEEKTNTLTITNTQQEYLTFFNKKTNEQEEKQNTETALLQCLDELDKIDIGNYSKEEFKKMFVEFCKPRRDGQNKKLKQKTSKAMKMTVNCLKELNNKHGLNAYECLNTALSSDWRGIKVVYFKNEIEKQKKENKIIPSTPLKNMLTACRDFLFNYKYDVNCLLNIMDVYNNKNSTNIGYKCCQMLLQYQADKHFDKLIKKQSEIDKIKQSFFENINSTLLEAHKANIKYIPLVFLYNFFLDEPDEWEKEYDIFFFEAFKNKTKINEFIKTKIIDNKEYINKQISQEDKKRMKEYLHELFS